MRGNFRKFFKPSLAALAAVVIGVSFAAGGFAQTAARAGQLVYTTNSQGKHPVYMVGNDGLYAFPNPAVFYSWGYTFSGIVPANSSEVALQVVAVIQTKQSGCSSPLSACGFTPVASTSGSVRVGQLVYNPGNKTVFLVGNDNLLHPFSSAAVFYSWNF